MLYPLWLLKPSLTRNCGLKAALVQNWKHVAPHLIMARWLETWLNTNSAVIPSVRQSNRQNVSTETKWMRPIPKDCRLSLSVANGSKTFKRVNPRKAAGIDGIPSRVLNACSDQLAGVFTDILNLSLSQSAVPTCFKISTIVPVPNKAKVTERLVHTPHCPFPSGQYEYLCKNAVHWL